MLEEEDRKEIIKLQEATHTSVIAFVLSLFIPLIGLILGLRAKSEIDKSEHTKTGSAFAVAAIWIGAIGTLAWAALIALVLLFSVGGHDHGWGLRRGFDRGGIRSQGVMPGGMMGGGGFGYGGPRHGYAQAVPATPATPGATTQVAPGQSSNG
jgi:hypothetical protein